MSNLISSFKKCLSIQKIQVFKKQNFRKIRINFSIKQIIYPIIYRYKPVNSILFLTKYLKKESHAKELEKKYKEVDLKKKVLKINFNKLKKKEYLQPQEIQCKDFNLSFIIICENLKKLVKETGVYIAEYDLKRKLVTEEDEENRHIHPGNKKVIRYLEYNFVHSFLHGKYLELNQGVTYDLINGTPVQQQGNTGENADKKINNKKE